MNLIEKIEEMIEVINQHSIQNADDIEIDSRVLDSMRQILRHEFIENSPYEDAPEPIGFGQTISQPFIVAYMTDKLDVQPSHKVLEIGTGSGYQAAVLSRLCSEIYTVERIQGLVQQTESILKGYDNIKTKVGNGYDGWEDNAPYDRIMVTAMSDSIPLKLVDQLKYEGKMIIPIKHKFPWGWGFNGRLCLVIRTGTNHMLAPTYDKKSLIRVQFVPLVRD